MRNIEFRAWLKDEKKMVEVVGIDWDIRRIYYNEDCYLMEALFNEIELMQFAGLCDKNGKKIFEGDIVRDSNGIGFIYYDEGGFAIKYNHYIFDEVDSYSINLLLYENDKYFGEVIGNIYENKELLEEK